MKLIFRGFFAMIALFIISGFIVFFFSETELKYKCEGSLFIAGHENKKLLFLKLVEYRPWVKIWSDNKTDGHLDAEIPNEMLQYFSRIEIGNPYIGVFKNNEEVGVFSKVSKFISIRFGNMPFEGACTNIDK